MPPITNNIAKRAALDALDEAKAALGTLTPLKINCGKLCGGACCEPDETGENGMLLFPFEDELYQNPIEGFPFRLADDDTIFQGGKRFICEGECRRDQRPLACRLFPLRIRLDGAQAKAELDPRAWAVCPLLEQGGMRAMSQEFIAAVEKAGQALAKNEHMLQALQNEQRLLDEMRRL